MGHVFQDPTIGGNFNKTHLGNNYSTHYYNAPSVLRPTPQSTVPFARNDHFVGREDILEQLRETFSRRGRHNRAALQGLGGVGKSQIAIEFAYRYRDQHPDRWSFYIHAGSTARFTQDYCTIAKRVKIAGHQEPSTNLLSTTRDWLSDVENGSWLMIIDNADDRDLLFKCEDDSVSSSSRQKHNPLCSYIPQCTHGDVLITSRNHTGAEVAGGQDRAIPIAAFEEDAAMELLELKLPGAIKDTSANHLTAALDNIPLAINQAAAYIRKTGITISKYLSLLRESEPQEFELLSKEYHDLYQDSSSARAITTSWRLSYERIRATSSVAADALAMMCMMDRQSIPEEIVFLEENKESEDHVPEIDRLEAIGILLEYSFIQRGEATVILRNGEEHTVIVYSMHRLVQLCTRAFLRTESKLDLHESKAAQSLTYHLRGAFNGPNSRAYTYLLMPHFNKVEGYFADHLRWLKENFPEIYRSPLEKLLTSYIGEKHVGSMIERACGELEKNKRLRIDIRRLRIAYRRRRTEYSIEIKHLSDEKRRLESLRDPIDRIE